jgi:hypothetical protein
MTLPSTSLPETVWIAARWYERFDGYEYVESVLTDRGMVAAHIAYGYDVRQYVRTASQPFQRRPLTREQATAAGEWSDHREPREVGLFCDACYRDGSAEHCTGYYFDPSTEDEGIVVR